MDRLGGRFGNIPPLPPEVALPPESLVLLINTMDQWVLRIGPEPLSKVRFFESDLILMMMTFDFSLRFLLNSLEALSIGLAKGSARFCAHGARGRFVKVG